MSWIKRNLAFVVGGAIAVVLMGVAAFYLHAQTQTNANITASLETAINDLKTVSEKDPFPNDENIAAIKADHKRVLAFQAELEKHFNPPAPIPKMSQQEFAGYLERSIQQMQKMAYQNSVVLPQDYNFTFGPHRTKLKFADAAMMPLTAQIEDVRALVEVFFNAKVNVFDSLKRVRVVSEDSSSDVLPISGTTNTFSVATPYEVSFRGFSGEIAAVLDGLLRSTNCYIVKTVQIVPAFGALPQLAAPVAASSANKPSATFLMSPAQSAARTAAAEKAANDRAFAERYGPRPAAPRSAPAQPTFVAPNLQRLGVAPALETVLEEKPLKVTILLELVKLKPRKS